MGSANEWWRHYVTYSLIGWAHGQNEPWLLILIIQLGHNFAHVTTAQNTGHVSNSNLISSLFFMFDKYLFSQDLNYELKKLYEIGQTAQNIQPQQSPTNTISLWALSVPNMHIIRLYNINMMSLWLLWRPPIVTTLFLLYFNYVYFHCHANVVLLEIKFNKVYIMQALQAAITDTTILEPKIYRSQWLITPHLKTRNT